MKGRNRGLAEGGFQAGRNRPVSFIYVKVTTTVQILTNDPVLSHGARDIVTLFTEICFLPGRFISRVTSPFGNTVKCRYQFDILFQLTATNLTLK